MGAFLNPWLLGGAALAAVPIVLHLVMRQKPKHVVFPALRLIQKREHDNRRRLRLRHLLLLALRVAAVCLLALALARPSIKLSGDVLGSREAPVAAAMVFDTSPRMAYRQENQTRLETARETALWLVDQLPDESDVAVFDTRRDDVQSGPSLAAGTFSIDLGAARGRIENLNLTPVADTFIDVARRAAELLTQSEHARKEIYLFTDLSEPAWSRTRGDRLRERLAQFDDLGVYVIDVGVDEPANVALGDLTLSAELMFDGGDLRLATDVTTLAEGGNRTVELWVEGPKAEGAEAGTKEKRGEASVEIETGGSAPVEFVIRNLALGSHQGYLRLVGQDGLSWDDQRYFTVEVVPAWRVLIAAADPDKEAFFLHEALAPRKLRAEGRARFDCDLAELSELSKSLAAYDAVCVLDPRPLASEAWRELTSFAVQGGGVAIFLGRHAQKPAFNGPAAQALLPGKLDFIGRDTTHLATDRADHPLLRILSRDSIPWDQYPVRAYWRLDDELNEGVDVLMRYANNRPALLHRSTGKGNVLVLTTPVSDRVADANAWNDLTGFESWPFVVLANEMLRYLTGGSDTRLNYAAGSTANLPLRGGRRIEGYVLTTPSGTRHGRQSVRPIESILETSTAEPGNYRVESTEAGLDRGFSTNLPAAETDLTRITPETLAERFGSIPFRTAGSRETLEREVGAARVGRELFPLLAVLLAIALGMEHLMANRFYRTE